MGEELICRFNSSLIPTLAGCKLSHLEGWDQKEAISFPDELYFTSQLRSLVL